MDAITRRLAEARRALAAGRGEEALAIGRELVRKHPQNAAALNFVGYVYCLAGKHALAIPFLRRAVAAAPGDTAIALSLGRTLAEAGLVDEAFSVVDQAEVSTASSHRTTFDGQMLLGDLHRRRGSLADALACFTRARELAAKRAPGAVDSDVPNHDRAIQFAAASNNAANVLCEAGRIDEALDEYRRAIEASPRFADAWTNLAAMLLDLRLFAVAADVARRAVKLDPRQISAWITFGSALAERGDWKAARRAGDAALTVDPLSAEARYNRSLAGLALGDWTAWEDYRLRHVVEPTVKVVSGLPRWRGESLEGKTVLVRREQGIGTQIMFSGFLPALANLSGRVLVECDARLRLLLSRTLPGIDFAPSAEIFSTNLEGGASPKRTEAVEWLAPKPEVEVAIGDLPGMARRGNGGRSWSDRVLPPRLCPDALLVKKWSERLARLGGGLHVGVSWRGGGTSSARQKRSTTLDAWSPVFETAGVDFVSLQYGDVDGELAEHEQSGGVRLHRWDDFDPRDDLDDLAALVAALDLVISVDNSTVHLAGAVGAPVWVLLPHAADWRWLVGRSDSPWYPSAELFRPKQHYESWPDIFALAGRRLRQLVSERHRGNAQAG